jgi:hypothetical protein
MGKETIEEKLLGANTEILETLKEILQVLKGSGSASTSASATVGAIVFQKGKYKGKTPEQVLDTDPGYIEFIYKTFILQPHPQSGDWQLVTEHHYNMALSRSAEGSRTPTSGMTTGKAVMEPDEEDTPTPAKKKKPVPKYDINEDNVPF